MHKNALSGIHSKHIYLKITDIVYTLLYNYSYYKMVIENELRIALLSICWKQQKERIPTTSLFI